MATSQNGWSAITSYGDPLLYTWTIPAKTGVVRVTLRRGSAGFLLALFLLWYAEKVEPLVGRIVDDWGYALRLIRGDENDLSNHSSGTAADHNATQHPLGVSGTLTLREKALIAARLLLFRGCLRHGAFYRGRVDPMHVEIDKPMREVEACARRLMTTPRGKRLLAANPSQKAVILS